MSLITIDCIELNAIEKLIHAGAKRLIFSLSFVSARPCCCLDLPQLREAIDLVHKYDCEAAINFTRFFMEEELVSSYLNYLKYERALSKNTLDAYGRDIFSFLEHMRTVFKIEDIRLCKIV